jgi:hypothetical protein
MSELTRRQMVGAGGIAGVALLIGGVRPAARGLLDADVDEAEAATCVMTPAKTEGPYFVDEKLNRSDISEGQAGVPLALTMYVFDADSDCAPVENAQVDIWHANASGLYSDESVNGTSGQTWLRGYQKTDASGRVQFTTIYPGWYSGRAVHIHFKVRTSSLEFTSQLFFTDAMNDEVFQRSPYNTRGNPDTTDSRDGIYGSDGSTLTLQPQSDGSGGYTADFSVGVTGGSGSSATTSDTTVNAALRSMRMIRTASGRRRLRLRIRSTERVSARARLTRNGRTLARRGSESLATGTHTLNVDIPSGARAGAATLHLSLTDASGNTKTVRRAVHVRRRAA